MGAKRRNSFKVYGLHGENGLKQFTLLVHLGDQSEELFFYHDVEPKLRQAVIYYQDNQNLFSWSASPSFLEELDYDYRLISGYFS